MKNITAVFKRKKKHGEAGLLEVDVPWQQRKITQENLDGQVFASSMWQQK